MPEPVVEGEFCFFVRFFYYDAALTPRPCPSLSLLANATVAGAAGWWFAGRGTPEVRPPKQRSRVDCNVGLGRARGYGRGSDRGRRH